MKTHYTTTVFSLKYILLFLLLFGTALVTANTANISCGNPTQTGNVTVTIILVDAEGNEILPSITWTTAISASDDANGKAAKIRAAAPPASLTLTIAGAANAVTATSAGGATIKKMIFTDDNTNELEAHNTFSISADGNLGQVSLAGVATGGGSVSIQSGTSLAMVTTIAGQSAEDLEDLLLAQLQGFGLDAYLVDSSVDPILYDILNPDGDGRTIVINSVTGLLEVAVFDTGIEMEAGGLLDAALSFLFEALLNTPLGNSVLDRNESGNLVVSNIGSSGQDGVSIDLGESEEWSLQWNMPQIDPFGEILINSQGSVGGVPDQELGFIHIQGSGDSFFDIVADFSAGGTNLMRIELFLGGEEVLVIENQPLLQIGRVSELPGGCGKLFPPGGLYCYRLPFPPGTLIDNLPGFPPGTSFLIDELRVLAENSTGTLDFLSETSINFTGHPNVLFLEEQAKSLFPCGDLLPLDPLGVPLAPYPRHPIPPGGFLPLPADFPIDGLSVLPPQMLIPGDAFNCGTDYWILVSQQGDYEVHFERAGPYFIQYSQSDGTVIDLIAEVGVRSGSTCDDSGPTLEIACGTPDLAVTSSTLGFTPHWPNAGTSSEATNTTEAAQAICNAYDANGMMPISVAVDAHGSPGSITIGNTTITVSNMSDFTDAVKGKISELTLFSCEVGQGDEGLTFLCQLEAALGCNVVGYTGTVWDEGPDAGATNKWYTSGAAESWVPGDDLYLAVKALLQGCYDSGTGLMHDDLRLGLAIPPEEPYSGLEYNYNYQGAGAGTTIDPAVLTQTGPNAVVDWVVLEVRDPVDLSILLFSQPALIQRDGDIINPDGGPVLIIPVTPGNRPTDAYIDVLHRTHLGHITPNPVSIPIEILSLDLTSTQPIPGNPNAGLLEPGVFGLVSGDTNFDGIVDSADRSITWNQRNQVGYLPADLTLDGVVDAADRSGTWNNRNLFPLFPY